jgi:lipoprotein-anchoring transpeptidase ErfK/SrfK
VRFYSKDDLLPAMAKKYSLVARYKTHSGAVRMTYRKAMCLFQVAAALAGFSAAISPLAAQNGAPPPPPLTQAVPAPVLQVEPEGARPPVGPPPVVTDVPTPPVVAPTPKPLKKRAATDSLKPGQFVWEPRDSYTGPLKIVVILDIQRMYVFDNDSLVAFSTISSGKKGKETPTGDFTILQKNIDHKSNLYSDAPMPFMQRLTWDGIALHAGRNPGYPASHGCIRLPPSFAKALFGITKMDDRVVVLQDTSKPAPPKIVPPKVVPPKVEPPVEVVPPTVPAVEPVAVVVPAKKG